jgi:hypothetical protein
VNSPPSPIDWCLLESWYDVSDRLTRGLIMTAAKRNAFSAVWSVLRLLLQNMTTLLQQQQLHILCG